MDKIAEHIQQQITSRVPAVRYTDYDWGQMDYWGEHPVKYPCVLIDPVSVSYSNEGKHTQRAVCTVVVRVYNVRLTNTSAAAPPQQKQHARHVWGIANEVVQALHAQPCLPGGYGTPCRTQMARIRREDSIQQIDITFTIHYEDNCCLQSPENYHKATPLIRIATKKATPQ